MFETWLWHAAALAMASAHALSLTTLLVLQLIAVSVYSPWLNKLLERLPWAAIGPCEFSICVSLSLVALSCWAVYPFARLSVLLESFARLRNVQRDVYRTIQRTNFLPNA